MDKVQLQKYLDNLLSLLKEIDSDMSYYHVLNLVVSTHIDSIYFQNLLNDCLFEDEGEKGIEINTIAMLLRQESIQQDAVLNNSTGEAITKAILTENGTDIAQIVQVNKKETPPYEEPDYSSKEHHEYYKNIEEGGCTMFMPEPQ